MNALPIGLITGKTARLPTDWKQQPAAVSPGSDLEEGFFSLWIVLFPKLPEPVREHRFHAVRKWRFDFAWPDQMLAVELEGMAYGGGRHQRRVGFTKDAEKYREAVKAGWRVLRYTSDELRERPIQIVEEVATILEKLEGNRCTT